MFGQQVVNIYSLSGAKLNTQDSQVLEYKDTLSPNIWLTVLQLNIACAKIFEYLDDKDKNSYLQLTKTINQFIKEELKKIYKAIRLKAIQKELRVKILEFKLTDLDIPYRFERRRIIEHQERLSTLQRAINAQPLQPDPDYKSIHDEAEETKTELKSSYRTNTGFTACSILSGLSIYIWPIVTCTRGSSDCGISVFFGSIVGVSFLLTGISYGCVTYRECRAYKNLSSLTNAISQFNTKNSFFQQGNAPNVKDDEPDLEAGMSANLS